MLGGFTSQKRRVIPLGSCSLTIPLLRLKRRELVVSALKDVGFERWPLSFSAGAALQVVNVARGRLNIPSRFCKLCLNGVPDRVAADADTLLSRADLVLVEISTPFELHFRRFILNHNKLRTYVSARFRPLGEAAEKAARQWFISLRKRDQTGSDRRARELIELSDDSDLKDRHLRAIITETASRYSGEEEITRYLGAIRESLGLPLGVVIFIFRYLPDGRPVDWPAGFNDNVRRAAQRLGIPVYDPAPIVQKHGVRTAIDSDGGHYSHKFNEHIADEYARFMTAVLDGKRAS